uniref:ATP synthase subunit 8 n=1 Tax=Amblyomma papuanum TaxID=3065601 RepID=UPI0030FEEB0F
MPQIFPMNWIIISLMITIMMIISSSFIYFFSKNTNISNMSMNKSKKNKFYLKW